MWNFFQNYESSKYRKKFFGYPYPVPVWKQFLHIRIRLQTRYLAGYPTGNPDSDHLWCKYYIKPQQDVNILCPADLSVKAKSQVYLCVSWLHFGP